MRSSLTLAMPCTSFLEVSSRVSIQPGLTMLYRRKADLSVFLWQPQSTASSHRQRTKRTTSASASSTSCSPTPPSHSNRSSTHPSCANPTRAEKTSGRNAKRAARRRLRLVNGSSFVLGLMDKRGLRSVRMGMRARQSRVSRSRFITRLRRRSSSSKRNSNSRRLSKRSRLALDASSRLKGSDTLAAIPLRTLAFNTCIHIHPTHHRLF